jgi:histidinol dehydrogenase
MTVVPAIVAGVKEIVIASPPTGGDIDPLVKAIAWELGIREVYRIGGAVAIGALAYGTRTVKAVSKIVGPGNAFVAEAKRRVFGRVGIDSIAGPSEVCILADSTADPELVACDLVAQAEHDPGSGILVTPDMNLAQRVLGHLQTIVPAQKRHEQIANALEKYSAIFVVLSLDKGVDLVNEIASEHLEVMVADAEKILPEIRNAGAIFIGANTPVPIGDYWAGPSHVLPTGGGAKFLGPLSCNDFLKSASVIEYDGPSIKEDADDAAAFAEYEGLFSHAYALKKRL